MIVRMAWQVVDAVACTRWACESAADEASARSGNLGLRGNPARLPQRPPPAVDHAPACPQNYVPLDRNTTARELTSSFRPRQTTEEAPRPFAISSERSEMLRRPSGSARHTTASASGRDLFLVGLEFVWTIGCVTEATVTAVRTEAPVFRRSRSPWVAVAPKLPPLPRSLLPFLTTNLYAVERHHSVSSSTRIPRSHSHKHSNND